MALQAAVGSFTMMSGTGTQAITGVGFVPKVVLFFGTRHANASMNAFLDYDILGTGFDDGITRACNFSQNNDNKTGCDAQTGGSNQGSNGDYSIIAIDPDAINPIYIQARIASMDVDGFTIQIDKNTIAGTDTFNFIAFAGLGVSATVKHFATPSGTGHRSVAGFGFQPSVCLFMGVGGGSSQVWHSLGWAVSSTQRGSSAIASNGQFANPCRTNRYQRSDKCLVGIGSNTSPSTITFEADFVSMDADGFTWDVQVNPGITYQTAVLALGGIAAAAIAFNQQTATGSHAITGIGVQPAALLMMSVGNVASSVTVAGARFSFGATDGIHQRSVWVGDQDNVSTTVTAQWGGNADMLTMATEAATGSASTVNARIAQSSLDPDGWTSTYLNADGTSRQGLALALGVAVVTPPTPGDDPCTMPGPTHFVAIQPAAGGAVSVFAQRPLRDPASYFGGYKAPRILELGTITRAASDWWTGAWQAQQASVKLADTDLNIRTALETLLSYANSGYWHYVVGEATRRALGNPRLLFFGRIFDDPLTEDLTVSIQSNDLIGSAYNLFAQEAQIPRRTITTTDFPSLPDESKGTYGSPLGVPIILGSVSDEAKASPKGQVKVINVGPLTLNGVTYPAVGLLCGHAVTSIINGYVDGTVIPGGDYGSTIFAPGKTNWNSIVPSGDLFVDINGRRYTLIPTTAGPYADALTNGKTIAFNVQGLDDSAVGTGSLVTDIVLQYKYLLLNFLVGDYQSGGWLGSPTFEFFPGGASLNVIDVDSFDAANLSVLTQFGGVAGGVVIGADGRRQSIRQVMQDVHLCLPNVRARQDQTGRYGVVALNRSRAAFLAGRRTSDWRRDIFSDPKRTVQKKREWHFNEWPYQYEPDYNGGDFFSSGEKDDAPSVSRYGKLPLQAPRQYLWLRDSTSAGIVAQQQLDFASDPPKLYSWAESLCGLRNDVLDGLPITDYQPKWTDQAVWIDRQAVEPRTNRALMAAFDVDRLLS